MDARMYLLLHAANSTIEIKYAAYTAAEATATIFRSALMDRIERAKSTGRKAALNMTG